jgi:hypothetical protein
MRRVRHGDVLCFSLAEFVSLNEEDVISLPVVRRLQEHNVSERAVSSITLKKSSMVWKSS